MSSKTTKRINQITSTIILLAIRVVLVVAIIIVAGRGIKAAYDFGHSIFYSQSVEEAPGHDVTVRIEKGDTIKDVADMLKNRGLVDNKYSIIVQAKFFDYEVNPGQYTFNTSQTSREILMQINDARTDEASESMQSMMPQSGSESGGAEETEKEAETEELDWLKEKNDQ